VDDLSSADPSSVSVRLNTTATISLQLQDAAGNVVAVGSPGAANFDRGLTYVAPTTGTYFVRVVGVTNSNYDLVVTRNAVFESEFNDVRATAPDITGKRSVLGALSSATDVDFYKITMTNSTPLFLATSTPSDGPFEFTNTLNPQLQLLNAAGTVIANGTVQPDGRNETIAATLNPGTYFVRIGSQNSTQGEYLLTANQAPVAVP